MAAFCSIADPIARFVKSKNSDFSVKYQRVKPGAFLPRFEQDHARWERSVYRIHELDLAQIADLAKDNNVPAKGFGWLGIEKINETGLHFEDDIPPERHGEIVGWPGDASRDEEGKRLELATKLAERAKLKLFEAPVV